MQLAEHCIQAERMAIACIIEDEQLATSFPMSLFYDSNSIAILKALQQVKPSLNVVERLYELMKVLPQDVWTIAKSAQLELPSVYNWPYWRSTLVDFANARREEQLKEELGTGDPGTRMEVMRQLDALNNDASISCGRTVGEIMPDVISRLEEQFSREAMVTGLPTGLSNLDRSVDGWEASRLYVIGARPGFGKTSLLIQSCLHASEQPNTKALFLSLEMPKEEVTQRALQILSKVSIDSVRRKQVEELEGHRLISTAGRLGKLPFSIIDTCHDLASISSNCIRSVRENGVKAIFIDYLQLIHVKGFRENRTAEVTLVSSSLKRMAMELRVPVIAAAQLNRSVTKEDRRPNLSDLRESGSIEQDADCVLFLHPKDDDPNSDHVSVTGIVAKNRSGPCGDLWLHFHRPTTSWSVEDRIHNDEPPREIPKSSKRARPSRNDQ